MEIYGKRAAGLREFPAPAMISEPIRVAYADKKWPTQKAYLDSLSRQARAAESLSLVSPTGVFRAIASAICRTDLASHARRMDRTRQYRESFVRWLQGKDAFGSFSWITPTDPATFKTEDELVANRTGGEFKTAAGVRGLGLRAEGLPGPLVEAQRRQSPRRQPGRFPVPRHLRHAPLPGPAGALSPGSNPRSSRRACSSSRPSSSSPWATSRSSALT